MDDFELYIMQSEARRMLKRQKYFKQISDTVRDGSVILNGMSLIVAKRFGIDMDEEEFSPCWKIVEHFIFNDAIDCDFREWLYSDDAPFLCHLYDVGKFFPEFKGVAEDDRGIVDLANQCYGLDLKTHNTYGSYVYSFSLNFNNFVPIDFKKLKSLKDEIVFCRKYGVDCSHILKEVEDMGVDLELFEGV